MFHDDAHVQDLSQERRDVCKYLVLLEDITKTGQTVVGWDY